MGDNQSPATGTRRWGFACLTCRRKKIRCDGGKPVCRNWIKAGEDCAYKASDTVNNELSAELRRKTDDLSGLKAQVRRLAQMPSAERDSAISELLSNLNGTLPDDTGIPGGEGPEGRHVSELSVDESGDVRPYGATSRFHATPYEAAASKPDSSEEEYHRKWLKSNARFQQSLEDKALQRLQAPEISADIAFDQATMLLDIYWTWQAPLHNCIYRRYFYRDMALGGPYFSLFLLCVIFAHASRHIGSEDTRFAGFGKGEDFLLKAKGMLIHVLETPTIPTVQGLLSLGGRQCSVGKTSEGWLYTSMAIAMIKDMGLHLRRDAGALYKDHEPDDLEARKRLYLSAYLWDKSLSLCVGRQPSLPEMPYPQRCLLDDADNASIWKPVHLGLENLRDQYPQPTHSHNTENFMYFVELATIINQVYAVVYGARNRSVCTPAALYDLEHRLRSFHNSLPQHLRIDSVLEEQFSPPPHMLTVNILYRTALILLFRPFYQAPSTSTVFEKLAAHAHDVCISEAVAVNSSFRAYGRTFNFRMQTHLLSYCVYTAASVDVHGTQPEDIDEASAATQRLELTLHMLGAEAEQTPGVRKSVDIIRSRIKHGPHSGVSPAKLSSIGQTTLAETARCSVPFQSSSSPRQISANDRGSAVAAATSECNEALPMTLADGMAQYPFAQNHVLGPGVAMQTLDNVNDPWLMWNDLDISGGFGPSDAGNFWH